MGKLFPSRKCGKVLTLTNQNSREILITSRFKKDLAQLAKRYRSIRKDLNPLIEQLQKGELIGMFLGYLNEFPDHWTQGVDLEDLKENLADLYKIFTSEEIPGIKRVAEFELA